MQPQPKKSNAPGSAKVKSSQTPAKLTTQEINLELTRAKRLIQSDRTLEARLLLSELNHPVAKKMLSKLNARTIPATSRWVSIAIGISVFFLIVAIYYFFTAVIPHAP